MKIMTGEELELLIQEAWKVDPELSYEDAKYMCETLEYVPIVRRNDEGEEVVLSVWEVLSESEEGITGEESAMLLEQHINSVKSLKELTPRQKVGRNDPCPCESGKKYKRCCLKRRKMAADAHSKRAQGPR